MNFIYETPWWLPGGCLVLSIILFVTGNNRLERKLKNAGLALVGLGVLIAVVSFLLDSPREKAMKRTRMIVAAVDKRDWATMQSLLHPEIALVGWRGRAAIVEGAKYYAERYDLKSARASGIEATEAHGTVVVSMMVTADFREFSGVMTRWKLEWEETAAGWVLVAVEPLGGPMIDAATIEGRFKGPPR